MYLDWAPLFTVEHELITSFITLPPLYLVVTYFILLLLLLVVPQMYLMNTITTITSHILTGKESVTNVA